jgi:hypothetical protein
MKIEVEPQITEYFVATVDREKYQWTLHQEHTDSRYDTWFTIDAWCEQTFGGQGMWGGPNSTWKRMGPSYYFQHDKDRQWFVLRWS